MNVRSRHRAESSNYMVFGLPISRRQEKISLSQHLDFEIQRKGLQGRSFCKWGCKSFWMFWYFFMGLLWEGQDTNSAARYSSKSLNTSSPVLVQQGTVRNLKLEYHYHICPLCLECKGTCLQLMIEFRWKKHLALEHKCSFLDWQGTNNAIILMVFNIWSTKEFHNRWSTKHCDDAYRHDFPNQLTQRNTI